MKKVHALVKSMTLLCLLLLISDGVFAQTTSIKGKVTDSNNLGIPGVTVTIVGNNATGTITDLDGNYSISFKKTENSTLQFSFIGFKTAKVPVGSKTTINVQLEENIEQLSDVVVVGYGTQKKKTVVGSVVQTTGEDLLKVGNVSTVSEALAGLLPGVSTMQAAGMPGATEATILIRGQSSWNNNKPLYMVDGVERDFNDIDPNEIESISVLKDASATAVYGVKAANGVILITTKRGHSGTPRISFTANEGVKVPNVNTNYMADYATALEYYNVAAMSQGFYDNLQSQKDIDAWRNPNRDMDFYSYTNWINYLVKSGHARSYNINVSGGNSFVKYFTSLGYNYDGDMFDIHKQNFIDPRTSQKRYNWRSNLDFQFTKTTKVSVNVSGNFIDWNGNRITNQIPKGYDDNGNTLSAMYNNVQVGTPPILSTGELGAGDKAKDWMKMNYLGMMERESQNRKRSTLTNTDLLFTQKILKDFTLKAKVSYDFSESYASSIQLSPLYYRTDYRTGQKWLYSDNPDEVAGLPVVHDETLGAHSNSLYYEGSLLYEKNIKGGHNVSVLALFNRRKAQNKINFPSYEESWVGRATYAYKDKYLFEFNGAYNGSEKFDRGKRFGFFPSLSAGWVVSEENFFKENIPFVNFLKIRYSWGSIGSDMGAARFTYFSTYGSYSVNQLAWDNAPKGYPGGYGGTNSDQYMGTLYFEQKPANVDATWETSVKQNLGIDITLLGNKLKTNIDLFNENRTGILMTRTSIPSWYGGIAPDANIGATKNHGFDLVLTWNDKIGVDWQYRLSANLSMNENRIVERDDAAFTPEYQKQAGKPIGWKSGLQLDGIYNSWNDIYIGPTSDFATQLLPGDFRFADYNGDGTISNLDKVPIGLPSYASNSYAFNIGVSYKQISLSAVFNGVFGISKDLSGNYLWEFASSGGDLGFRMLNTEMTNYWSPDNIDAPRPALRTVDNKSNTQPSDYTRRRSDFLRLKNLELKYTFNKNDLSKIGFVKSFEIYTNANNLLTWSKLPKEFDPEAVSLEVYPIAKRYNIGVRATF